LCTPSKRIIILLHAAHDCPGGRTAAIARHVSFAQITCLSHHISGDAENARNENAAPKIRCENGKSETWKCETWKYDTWIYGKMNMRVRRMLKVMFTLWN